MQKVVYIINESNTVERDQPLADGHPGQEESVK